MVLKTFVCDDVAPVFFEPLAFLVVFFCKKEDNEWPPSYFLLAIQLFNNYVAV